MGGLSSDAGICASGDIPAEARDFYPGAVVHGRGKWQPHMGDSATRRTFHGNGSPLMGGGSGSVSDVGLYMNYFGDVYGFSTEEKEVLLLIFSAALVAAGHHSFAECLVPAVAFGFLQELKPLVDAVSDPGAPTNFC